MTYNVFGGTLNLAHSFMQRGFSAIAEHLVGMPVHLQFEFVYRDHWVKVRVTGARNCLLGTEYQLLSGRVVCM